MDFLYNIYFWFPKFENYFGFLGKIIDKLMEKLMIVSLNVVAPRPFSKAENAYELNREGREQQVIISLTSFPSRIHTLSLCIETLFRQTFKADKMILWLSKEQFSNIELPHSLIELSQRGLDIRWVNDDLKAHKKYHYAFKEFENEIIVTFDDDALYPRNVLQALVELHEKFPKAICANRVHLMTQSNGRLLPYNKWKHNCKDILKPSKQLMPVGIGGILYPPHAVSEEVFDVEVLKKICFFADDVWLKFHAMSKGTEVVTSKKFNKDFITIKTSQNVRLVSSNVFESGNDKQIQEVMNYYHIKL